MGNSESNEEEAEQQSCGLGYSLDALAVGVKSAMRPV